MKQIILIEHRNNSLSYKEQAEPLNANFFVKQWKYVRVTEEQLEEIKKVSTDRIQELLSKLF